MAKRFGGFTPEQLGKIVPEMQGMQADEQAKFLAATPGAAARVGRMTEVANKHVDQAARGFALGGMTGSPAPNLKRAPDVSMERFQEANKGAVQEFNKRAVGKAPMVGAMDRFQEANKRAVQEFNKRPFWKPARAAVSQEAAPTDPAISAQNRAKMQGSRLMGAPSVAMEMKMAERDFDQSAVMKAAREAEKALYTQAMQQAGLSGSPTNQEEADRFKEAMEPLVNNSKEIQDARKAQIKHQADVAAIQSNNAGDPTESPTTSPAQQQLDDAKAAQAKGMQALRDAQAAQAANPEDEGLKEAAEKAQVESDRLTADAQSALTQFKTTELPTAGEMLSKATTDPESMVTKADVATTTAEQARAGEMDPTKGQAGEADIATATTATTAAPVDAPTVTPAATVETSTATPAIEERLAETEAVTGELSADALVEAEQGTVSPKALASEVNKVAEDRINKVNENVNIEVTKEQLAEVKGKKLKAITANIAQSDALVAAVAETAQVQPEELPAAALIAEDQMAQAKAITDSGLDEDAIPIAAKLAKFSVDNGTLAKAMEGEVSAMATVEGQLSQLMKDFDDGTPAWAAGAMRAANAAMASRGLGASSMASAAILQAAMESALPIAQQDAQVFERMDLKNLDNRQQVALSNAAAQQGLALQNLSNEQQANLQRSAQAFQLQTTNLSNRQSAEVANAQIRATLQGKNLSNQQQTNIAVAARYAEQAGVNLNNKQQASMQTNANQLQTNLSNLSSKSQAYITNANLAASLQGQVLSGEQQVSISNAARFADAANISFTAQQQNTLHNSKMMQTVGLAELDANMSATLQNAATYAAMDTANLNNRQMAAVQNAKSFLEMDMTNLSNEQQTAMFKVQAITNAMLSDTAAENASKQFNASSENQTNQFFANLTTQVSQFNNDQANAMERFNAGEINAVELFNANQKNLREQFNATNALVVEQANAAWAQTIATTDNAATNQANRDFAQGVLQMTSNAFNAMMQETRDIMSYAFQSDDNDATRATNMAIAQIASDDAAAAASANKKSSLWSALGNIAATAAAAYIKS